ncbi:MAG TPA: TolC family protein [Clostridiales bacterium]|nr:TolC family protein [Clostridiales bacterium]
MKRIVLVLIAVSLLTARTMTLNDCISEAEKNNLDIKISDKDLRSTELNLKGAGNRFWDVSGSGSYTLDGDDDDNLYSNLSASAGVSGTVSPFLFHNYSYAKISANSTALNHSEILNSVRYKVINSFFQTLLAEENLKLQAEICEYSSKKFEEAQLKFNMGNISRSDLLSFEVSKSSDQIDLKAAESNLKKNKQNLIYYMNSDMITDSLNLSFTLNDDTENTEFKETDLLSEAVENRPDMKMMKNSLDQSELSLKMQYDNYLPSLTGSVIYDYSKMKDINNNVDYPATDGISARLGLSVNLTYSGLNGIDKEKVEVTKSRLQLDSRTESVKNEIRLKLIELDNQKNNLELAKKHVELAQENLDLADKLFFIGNKSATDYLQARNDYIQARYREISYQYNLIIVKYDLYNSLGRKL